MAAGVREKRCELFTAETIERIFEQLCGSYDIPMKIHNIALISTLHAAGCKQGGLSSGAGVAAPSRRRRTGIAIRF